MKTELTMINPIPISASAIQVAIERYKKWKGIVSFEADLADYLTNGCVVARPNLFGMAKIIALPGTDEPAWFIRMAVGKLPELLSCLPMYLPIISFCRHNDGRLRVYNTKRLIQLAEGRRKHG